MGCQATHLVLHEQSIAGGQVLPDILRLHGATLLDQPRLLHLRVLQELVVLARLVQRRLALVAQVVNAARETGVKTFCLMYCVVLSNYSLVVVLVERLKPLLQQLAFRVERLGVRLRLFVQLSHAVAQNIHLCLNQTVFLHQIFHAQQVLARVFRPQGWLQYRNMKTL